MGAKDKKLLDKVREAIRLKHSSDSVQFPLVYSICPTPKPFPLGSLLHFRF